MQHELIAAASPSQLEAAREAADWLIDAVAASTQDRRLLRGEPEADTILIESIEICGVVACLRAMRSMA